jgi:hypothetical protein
VCYCLYCTPIRSVITFKHSKFYFTEKTKRWIVNVPPEIHQHFVSDYLSLYIRNYYSHTHICDTAKVANNYELLSKENIFV